MKYVFDVEANGLLNQANKIWCITLCPIDSDKSETFTDELDTHRSISAALNIMAEAEMLIGHNVYAYDFPLLEKVKGWKYNGRILDTLLLSQLLNFDRGGHGLAQWGERFGIPKPKQEQWEFFEKGMIHRCQQDVQINKRVYTRLKQEFEVSKIPGSVVKIEQEVARISAEQVKNGWLMDVKLAEEYFSRPIRGWNIVRSDVEGFYEIENIYYRNFLKKDYLWPISQNELLRNPNLIQNPGW